jgi:citrate/tricarballylate utilization protein
MPPIDIAEQTIWQLDVCNACRYCEGYCAVFPALEKRRRVTPQDVVYLANLCHDCRACFYACMYAPPHEFGVNIPKALAEVRERTYAQYASPRVLTNLAERHGPLLLIASLVSAVFFLGVLIASGDPSRLFTVLQGPGAFYSVIPYEWMMWPAMLVSLYVIAVLVAGGITFLKDVRASARDRMAPRAVWEAAIDALALRYLRGGDADGCTYPSERASYSRYVLHMLVFWGFVTAFVATVIAFVMQHWFDLLPPYPLLSAPVLLGSVGGVAMIVGCTGLLWLKRRSDRAPADPSTLNLDWLFLVMLNVVSITGMLLLAFRETGAMGTLLIVHLVSVLALYVSVPYGKFAHFVYRYAALVQNRLESFVGRDHA